CVVVLVVGRPSRGGGGALPSPQIRFGRAPPTPAPSPPVTPAALGGGGRRADARPRNRLLNPDALCEFLRQLAPRRSGCASGPRRRPPIVVRPRGPFI